MANFWPDGIPVKVHCTVWDTPSRIYWQGQMHRVQEIVQQQRVTADWWQAPVERDYFKLRVDSGWLLVIFYDFQDAQWFVQRLYL